MKRLVFVIFVGFFSVFAVPQIAQGQLCGDCLSWQAGIPLKWEDFKATPDPVSRMLDYYNITITYEYWKNDSGNYVFDVHCNFAATESWCIKEKVRPYMLEHIQGNFDIGELYARKLKQELYRYAALPNFNKGKIKWLYNKNEEERLSFNYLYNLETNHGYYFKDQEEWNQKIAALLGGLTQYASR